MLLDPMFRMFAPRSTKFAPGPWVGVELDGVADMGSLGSGQEGGGVRGDFGDLGVEERMNRNQFY